MKTIHDMGYEAIIINNNPETVSTDYTTADKLYFEPLTVEDIMNIIDLEKPEGVITSLGGQTAVNLAEPLTARGVRIIGTDSKAVFTAEDRNAFEEVVQRLGIPHPEGTAVHSIQEGIRAASGLGYPVLVRPSFVLGGRAMEIVANEEMLEKYLKNAVEVDRERPVLIDKYIVGKEVEVDAVCDGKDVFLPGMTPEGQWDPKSIESLASGDSSETIDIFPTAMENNFKVGDIIVQAILKGEL